MKKSDIKTGGVAHYFMDELKDSQIFTHPLPNGRPGGFSLTMTLSQIIAKS